ncbi:MAG TPA: SNF2-related protein, partial [Xylella sp.]
MKLRRYQHTIVEFILTHPRCNLFVPMGLGKTVSTLTALDVLM